MLVLPKRTSESKFIDNYASKCVDISYCSYELILTVQIHRHSLLWQTHNTRPNSTLPVLFNLVLTTDNSPNWLNKDINARKNWIRVPLYRHYQQDPMETVVKKNEEPPCRAIERSGNAVRGGKTPLLVVLQALPPLDLCSVRERPCVCCEQPVRCVWRLGGESSAASTFFGRSWTFSAAHIGRLVWRC